MRKPSITGWRGLLLTGAAVALIAAGALILAPQEPPPVPGFATAIPALSAETSPTGWRVAETSLAAEVAAGAVPLPLAIGGVVEALPALGVEGSAVTRFRHRWPATYARARFEGDSLIVAFDDPENRYRLTIDGGAGLAVLISRPGRLALRFDGLGPGPHEARIDRISEAAPGIFDGFHVPGAGLARDPPAPLPRRIEFIGDSDTVGYGNLSPQRDCALRGVFAETDAQASYGPQVARHFGAEYRIIAQSGIGLIRNGSGNAPGNGMSAVYPWQAGEGWSPDVVVVALGSNDFVMPIAPGEPWADEEALRTDYIAQYVLFARELRLRHPAALLLIADFRDYTRDFQDAHQTILARLREDGVTGVDLVSIPRLERLGCDWHPSMRDHGTMVAQIIHVLKDYPRLWQEQGRIPPATPPPPLP